MELVRNHSHWGAFLAEVEDGRVVGVQPFERDPDPSHLIGAIPDAVHSQARIAQPMVREGWLKHGPGHGSGRGEQSQQYEDVVAAVGRRCRQGPMPSRMEPPRTSEDRVPLNRCG